MTTRQTIIGLIIITTFFLPINSNAEAKSKIGDTCIHESTNADCELDGADLDCEISTKKDASGNSLKFCDCAAKEDCDNEYGTPVEGSWACSDGAAYTYDLDYCYNTKTKEVRTPIGIDQNASIPAGLTDAIFDSPAAKAALLEEVKTFKPTLQIKIPGLELSDLEKTIDEEGYIYIPWIGELVKSVYNFVMVIVSIVAVVMLIIQGARIITGGGEGKMEGYKKIGQIVIGLFIAWGSYAILYTINPALVEFKSLKIKYVEGIPLENILTELVGGDPDISGESTINIGPGIPGKYRDAMMSVCGDRNGFSLPTYEERLKKLETIISKWKEVGVDQGGAIYTRGGSWNCGWFNIDSAWAINVMANMLEKIPDESKMSNECRALAQKAIPLKYQDRVDLITKNPDNRKIADACTKRPDGDWFVDYQTNFVEKAKTNGLLCGDCAAVMRSMLFVCFDKNIKETSKRFDPYRPAQNVSTCVPRGAVDEKRYIFNPTNKPTAAEVIAQIPKMKPGDIIAWQNKGGGHIIMFTGNGSLPFEILEMGGGGKDDVGGGSGSKIASKNVGIAWQSSGMRAHISAEKYISSFAKGDRCVFIFRPILD